ncbi:SUMF1/EgtB/PvdO family nonheme iron enzyme, partial [Micromonospora sp. NPDC049049]
MMGADRGSRAGSMPVGAYPGGASPLGVHQLIGDVWEWTSTAF